MMSSCIKQRIKRLNLILSLLFVPHLSINSVSAVTYLDDIKWGGRLADKLIMFTKAKWVAYRYNLPFYYKPFKYSDCFAFHDTGHKFSSAIKRKYRKIQEHQQINGALDNIIQPSSNTLYIIHYFFTLPHWRTTLEVYDTHEIMLWSEIINDSLFMNNLKKDLKLRVPVSIFVPPSDKISVAVHVRKGGGFDLPLISPQLYDLNSLSDLKFLPRTPKGKYADRVWPLKFVPDQFYIDQIKRFSEMHNDAPMYVHIYTDDPNPEKFAILFDQKVNKSNITFGYRKNENRHDLNVLEDLFSMANSDCLIRTASNFSQAAQLLGNHRIVIYPLSAKWANQTLVIDQVGTYIRPSS